MKQTKVVHSFVNKMIYCNQRRKKRLKNATLSSHVCVKRIDLQGVLIKNQRVDGMYVARMFDSTFGSFYSLTIIG